jgi:hypothetical protein
MLDAGYLWLKYMDMFHKSGFYQKTKAAIGNFTDGRFFRLVIWLQFWQKFCACTLFALPLRSKNIATKTSTDRC